MAQELILNDGINLMLAHATPVTTNPATDQCALNEVPCISINCPWQPHFFGRGGNPEVGFNYTCHFFCGLEDIIANSTAIWDASGVAGKVGRLFPDDADGNAYQCDVGEFGQGGGGGVGEGEATHIRLGGQFGERQQGAQVGDLPAERAGIPVFHETWAMDA